MGLYDRDYTQADPRRQHFGASQIRFNLPRMTPVVKWLLISNVAVFAVGALIPLLGAFLVNWFAIDARSWITMLQPWRLLSYQFLHAYPMHLFVNMLSLFFLAPTLERHWGSRRFLMFYLGCGVAGGLLYLLLAAVGLVGAMPLVGASGAILGVLAACAILFPQFLVFILIFPVPIRIVAVIMTLGYIMNVLSMGPNAGGDLAHLGGLVAGTAYVLLLHRWERLKLNMHSQSWEKRLEESRRLRIEVDRILAKVHRSGLHSLTSGEKRLLKKATQEEIRRQQL